MTQYNGKGRKDDIKWSLHPKTEDNQVELNSASTVLAEHPSYFPISDKRNWCRWRYLFFLQDYLMAGLFPPTGPRLPSLKWCSERLMESLVQTLESSANTNSSNRLVPDSLEQPLLRSSQEYRLRVRGFTAKPGHRSPRSLGCQGLPRGSPTLSETWRNGSRRTAAPHHLPTTYPASPCNKSRSQRRPSAPGLNRYSWNFELGHPVECTNQRAGNKQTPPSDWPRKMQRRRKLGGGTKLTTGRRAFREM